MSTKLDGDKVFGRYKDILKEKDDLAGEVERSAEEGGGMLVKTIVVITHTLSSDSET